MSAVIGTVHAVGKLAATALRRNGDLLGNRSVSVVDDSDWPAISGELEAVLTLHLPDRDWSDATRLRLVQCLGVGTDRLLPLPGLPERVAIANAGGISAVPMAEYVVAALLHVAKQFPESTRLQRERRWTLTAPWVVQGRTAVILGTGPVGSATAARLAPFGVRCIGVCRRPRPLDGFDSVIGVDDLHQALRSADVLVVALPLNAATHHIVDLAALAALPDHAIVVNVARGSLIDELALESALRSGRFSGAVLDVVEHEPLPPQSTLWDCPRVMLTAHVSWHDPDMLRRVVALFAENVERSELGRPIRNEVDRDLGYPVRD